MKTTAYLAIFAALAVATSPITAEARSHHSSSGAIITGLAVGLGIGLLSSSAASSPPQTTVVYSQPAPTYPVVYAPAPVRTIVYAPPPPPPPPIVYAPIVHTPQRAHFRPGNPARPSHSAPVRRPQHGNRPHRK